MSVSDQFEFFFKGYYHWWNSYFTEFDNDTSNPGTLISIDDRAFWGFKDYGLNGVAKYAPGGGVEFYGGYDFQNYSGRDDVFLIGPQTESVHAPFAQIRTTEALIPNVKLSAGIRHNMPSDAQSATVWNVTGRWDITPNFFARGNLGTAFRLPDAYELYVIDPCCEQGNPNLKPENSLNFNGSIGGRLSLGMGTLTFEAVGFYREVTNKIEIVFDSNLNIDTFANSGATVDVLGGELILGVDLDDVFSANLSYSFNSTEAKGTNVQLADVPESLLKASFDYHPMRLPVGASLSVNHVGDVYRNAAGVQEYGNYTTVDVGARVYLGADRRHRIGVNVLNLFDKEYVTRVRTTTPDGGGAAYPYHFLGTPQAFILDYSYEFSLM